MAGLRYISTNYLTSAIESMTDNLKIAGQGRGINGGRWYYLVPVWTHTTGNNPSHTICSSWISSKFQVISFTTADGHWSASLPYRFTPGVKAPSTHWRTPRTVWEQIRTKHVRSCRKSNPSSSVGQPVAQSLTVYRPMQQYWPQFRCGFTPHVSGRKHKGNLSVFTTQ